MNLYQLLRALLERFRRTDSGDQTDTSSDQDVEETRDTESDVNETEDPPVEEHTPPSDDDEEETEDVNRSSDESLDITWPPNPCVDPPHRGVGDETIEVRLYWRVGDALGEWACKMAKPYVEYCYEEAWGEGYEVDCVIHPEPLPIDKDSRDHHGSWFVAFKEYYWHQLTSENRAKHANALIGHLPGVYGEGGGHYCVVNLHKLDGPVDHEPWRDDACIRERHYGGLGYSINSTLHEIGHCLGLSHDNHEPDQDDFVEAYGYSHVTVMNNSYHTGNGQIHILSDRVRGREPDLSY